MLHIKDAGFEFHPNKKVIKAAEYAALVKGKEIIEFAQNEATQIREDAKKAYESEKKRGLEEGLQEGKQKISEHMMEAVSKTVKNIETFEGQLIDLVTQAVKKIIGDLEEPERITRVVKNALAMLRNEKKVTIRVSPSDANHLQERIDEILKDFPGIDYIDITTDNRIEKGNCTLVSDIGVIDVRIDLQLEAIKKSLSKSIR